MDTNLATGDLALVGNVERDLEEWPVQPERRAAALALSLLTVAPAAPVEQWAELVRVRGQGQPLTLTVNYVDFIILGPSSRRSPPGPGAGRG